MPQDMNSDTIGSGAGQAGSASMRDDVSYVRDETVRQGAAAADVLKEGVRALGDEAKERARSLSEGARERAERYVEGGKEAVTSHLDTFAQAIRRASDELSQRDQTMASQVVRQAAGSLERLSRSIGGSDVGDMLDAARSFARSNPAAFIGGAVLAGLALGRFARASGHPSGDDWRRGDSDWGDAPGASSATFRRGVNIGDEGWTPAPYAGSAYAPGERSASAPATHGAGDAPPRAQGYAGGGMASDGFRSSPSSQTDTSVSGSAPSGAAQPGSISTGGGE